MVERNNEEIAVARQCELLNLPRSSYYFSSTVNDDCNLELMRLIDEQFTRAPFYEVRRMTAWLRTQGYEVNPKRVRRLFRRLGFQAIYPRRRIGFSSPGHKLYPYISKYHTVSEVRQGLRAYFLFYNAERLHQSLSYRTPHEVYFGGFKASNQAEAGS